MHSSELIEKKDINEILRLIEECLLSLEYIRALCILYGIRIEETPNQIKLIEKLYADKLSYSNLLNILKLHRKHIRILNKEQIKRGYKDILEMLNNDKLNWKNDIIKVICTDDKLIELANKFYNSGEII